MTSETTLLSEISYDANLISHENLMLRFYFFEMTSLDVHRILIFFSFLNRENIFSVILRRTIFINISSE